MDEFPDHVQEALQKIINENGITNYKVNLFNATKKGDNYLGVIHKVEIIGFKNNRESKLNLVCKVPGTNWKSDDNRRTHVPYKREVYYYKVVLKMFENLQNNLNIPKSEKFTSYVKFYAASDVVGQEFLILEDLGVRNFVMLNKNLPMKKEHIDLVITGLAKFHALSFVMRDQEPEKLLKVGQIGCTIIDMFGKKQYVDLCEFGLKQTLEILEEDGMMDLYKKIKHFKDNVEEFMVNNYNGKGSENHKVFIHGDCWNNNVMFRYQNGVPVEVCILDWQLAGFHPPVLDLFYFFYLCTDGDILDNYFDSYMDLYHKQLKSTVKNFGSDLNKLYPYEAFQKDLKIFGNYGVIFSSFALNFLLPDTETAPDLEELSNAMDHNEDLENCLGFKTIALRKLYEDRMRGIVRHAAKRNYI